MSIADQKYVSFTTCRRDGAPKSLPVWIADFGDGTVGFATSSTSYKVKRLKNDPRVEVQPSNSKGVVVPGSEAVAGNAVVVEGDEFDRCATIMKKEYGMQWRAITGFAKLMKLIGRGSGTDCAIKISPV